MVLFGFQPRKLDSHPKPLGRRTPETDAHIRAYGLVAATIPSVEHTMSLPWWHWYHDQGQEGACVGHGSAMERAIREKWERRQRHQRPQTVRFDPWWLWDRAKERDGWSDTNPGDDNGTSVSAAYDVLREAGAVRIAGLRGNLTYPGPQGPWGRPSTEFAVSANRWATSTDDIRACIARNQPVTIGVNWYSNFDRPERGTDGYYIGRGDLGSVRGGHCVCIYGASDRRQAFRVKNSWGRSYPLVWLPYATMQRLLNEQGEATVATDND